MKILLPNGQLASSDDIARHWPILRLAFRPLFWFGALFSALSISFWALSFVGYASYQPHGGTFFWHIHEMLFGFVVAIITGFLLTAVKNWSGRPSVTGKPLAALVLVWLLGRFLMAFPLFPDNYIIAIDTLYLPLAAYFLSVPIIKAKLWRNLFFVPLLLLMSLVNLLMHLSQQGFITVSYIHLSHIMILIVALVMCIMGGRVFPMFTANGTGTKKTAPINWLEKLALGSVILAIVSQSQVIEVASSVQVLILLLAGLSNFARALRWRIWVTWNTPLVWSLHLSYWSICVGFILLAVSKLTPLLAQSLAYHTITVGGMGLMILSMISRVSLGHTGRIIQVDKVMTFAFVAMLASLIARVFMPTTIDNYSLSIVLAAIFWVVAYGTFVIKYFPVLFKPRVDGSDG